jgi:hypothetical protein
MIPIVFAAEAGTLELMDRTGADVRAGPGAPTSYDALTAATARATVRDRRWSLNVGYSPTVSVEAIEGTPATPYVLQAENVGAIWHARLLTLSLTEMGSFGWQYAANLVPQPGALTQIQPVSRLPSTLAVLEMVSVGATVGAQYVPARRWALGLIFGYTEAGGAREVDRANSPLNFGLSGTASATYAMTHLDSAFVRVFGLRAWTHSGPCLVTGATADTANGSPATCAPDADIGTAVVGDQHVFSRSSTGMLGLGLGASRARLGPDQPYSTGYYPMALASYMTAFGPRDGRMSLRLDGQIAPLIDVRTGAVEYAALGSSTLRIETSTRAGLAVAVGILQSLSNEEERPTTTAYTSGTAEYPIGKYVSLTAIASYFWQDQAGAAATSTFALFVGATMHTLPVRFPL